MHVDYGNLARCKMVACGKTYGISLVGRDDVLLADAVTLVQGITELL